MAKLIYNSLNELLDIYPRKKLGRAKDLTNKKYNRITLICRVDKQNTSNSAEWACLCDCGNYFVATGRQVVNGNTKSCGCYNKEICKKNCKEIGKKASYKDYTNIKNPYYIFLSPEMKKDNQNNMLWKISCKKCNKIYIAAPSQIVSEKRRRGNNPCKCWQHISKGEQKICELLSLNNIDFNQHDSSHNCIFSDTGKKAIFDFRVNKDDSFYYIEFDGEQHFIPTNFGDKEESGESKFEKTKKHDYIKNQG